MSCLLVTAIEIHACASMQFANRLVQPPFMSSSYLLSLPLEAACNDLLDSGHGSQGELSYPLLNAEISCAARILPGVYP